MAVIATLDPAVLAVEPGGQSSVAVRVRNQGSIVDRFALTVVGPLAAWARANPDTLSLFPGQEGEATITFAPPRAELPRAGTYPFGVRVKAEADPSGVAVEEGRVTVGPFTDATAEIVPATSRGSRTGRHEVLVDNRGNAPLEIVVGAVDPDRLVDFQVTPDRFVLGPGERAGVSVKASVRDTFFLGSKVPHPFNVEVRPGRSEPIALRASMIQGPLLPSWLPIAGGLAVAGLVAVFTLSRLTGGSPLTAAGTDGGAGASASASVAPSGAGASPSDGPGGSGDSPPPPSAGGGGGASPTPSPSPTPGPFELTIVGDSIQTGGALSVKCPPDPADAPCLREALDTVRALTTTLGGPFGGRGIVNPDNTAVAQTLPVIMSRDVPFPFIAQEGSVTDQTDKIVIDLAPLLATEPAFAYAVVDSSAGPRRFVLPDQLARQLLETLYDPNPVMVDPMPTRTIPPVFFNYDPGVLQFDFEFSTPPP
ncbi:MAG TPA: hypothetical protein VFO05_13800 [Candidatus Limnocylindrales bacterium]|nr:hypothetical protein [Candidatus Limnocylindrales bacterium]